MTKTERTERMLALKALAEAKAEEWNEATDQKNYEAAFKADEEMTKAVNEYTALKQAEVFEECAESDDPMLEAVKRLQYETIRVKEIKVGELKIPTKTIDNTMKDIDLLKLHKKVDGGIGADPQWNIKAERLGFLLTAKVAWELGDRRSRVNPEKELKAKDLLKEISDSYAMSAIARDIDNGGIPTSNKAVKELLAEVIKAMIGEDYEPTDYDVNFLLNGYTKKSKKALAIACSNHRGTRALLANICNHIVLNRTYTAEYKTVKK